MRFKQLIFSLLAAALGLLSWQHLEGIGLGDPHQRGLLRHRAAGEDPMPG
jgi:hypothetical protein